MKPLLMSASLVMFVLCAAMAVHAKRTPPPQVPAVKHGDLEYRVLPPSPNNLMPGFIEARDTKQNGQIWLRQIYVIRRDPGLEGDVQDVFITKLKLDADRELLEITNERGYVYELDLKSLEVKTIKGQAVISR